MRLVKKNKGQTVLEILIATAITSVLLISLLQLGTYSNKTSIYSKNVNIATEYSSEMIEWLKSQRDNMGWQVFVEKLNIGTETTFCVNTTPNSFDNFVSNHGECSNFSLNGRFKREITLTPITHGGSMDEIQVLVTTSWDDGKYKTDIQSKLTKW